MGKMSNTWSLMGASWEVLKKDKEILVFPFISAICCLIVLGSFAIPVFMSNGFHAGNGGVSSDSHNLTYVVLFLFYFLNYFVITFFNTAIVACAALRMNGGDPTVSYGMQAAFERFNQIFGWALVQATVGMILRIIEDRSEWLGKLVAALLGMAWTVTSFLVVPVLVVENKRPIDAVKESTALLRKTWGEQLIGNFSFGLVFLALGIPAVILVVLGFMSGSGTGAVIGIVLSVLYIMGLALVQSALQSIFQTALYFYARDGRAPQGFPSAVLENAVARRG